jgi:hypothetical protein
VPIGSEAVRQRGVKIGFVWVRFLLSAYLSISYVGGVCVLFLLSLLIFPACPPASFALAWPLKRFPTLSSNLLTTRSTLRRGTLGSSSSGVISAKCQKTCQIKAIFSRKQLKGSWLQSSCDIFV